MLAGRVVPAAVLNLFAQWLEASAAPWAARSEPFDGEDPEISDRSRREHPYHKAKNQNGTQNEQPILRSVGSHSVSISAWRHKRHITAPDLVNTTSLVYPS